MDVYTKYVMNIPNITYSDKCYLILAYDQCSEEFVYKAFDVRKHFPAESYRRIEKRLLENNLIYRYPKGKGNFRLNYVWKDMYAPKVLK